MKPTSKKQNIVVQELESEVLVYDLQTNKAFVLNETSAMVFGLCDGTKTVSEIGDLMSRKLKTQVGGDFVWLALNELKRDGLLENADESEDYFASFSRREIIKKVGLASMIALPLVSSVIAPNAVQAGSCLWVNIPFCSPNPQPDLNTCRTYIDNISRSVCCPGLLRGTINFNPADGTCCGDCDFSN